MTEEKIEIAMERMGDAIEKTVDGAANKAWRHRPVRVIAKTISFLTGAGLIASTIIRLILIEQFRNSAVQKVYDRWMFTEPLSFQSKVFSVLIQMGVIQGKDSDYLAVKYYAPIQFFAQRWLFSGTLTEERKSAFRTSAYQYIQRFFNEIGVA